MLHFTRTPRKNILTYGF